MTILSVESLGRAVDAMPSLGFARAARGCQSRVSGCQGLARSAPARSGNPARVAPLSAGRNAETALFVTVTNKANERVGHVARIQQRQVPMTIDRKVPTASRREFTG